MSLAVSANSFGVIAVSMDRSLHVELGYDDQGVLSIAFARRTGQQAEPGRQQRVRIPLESECAFERDRDGNLSSLTCRAGGTTPLAGAAFIRRRAETIKVDCGEIGGVSDEVHHRLVCVRGCGPAVPKALDETHPCD